MLTVLSGVSVAWLWVCVRAEVTVTSTNYVCCVYSWGGCVVVDGCGLCGFDGVVVRCIVDVLV